MASSINKAIAVGIGLVLLFIMASTMIMPFFKQSWQYCQDMVWEGAQGGTLTNCTRVIENSNTTAVMVAGNISHTEGGYPAARVAADANYLFTNQFCLNCNVAGGYRTTSQGLTLLVLVIGLVGFAVYFFKR